MSAAEMISFFPTVQTPLSHRWFRRDLDRHRGLDRIENFVRTLCGLFSLQQPI